MDLMIFDDMFHLDHDFFDDFWLFYLIFDDIWMLVYNVYNGRIRIKETNTNLNDTLNVRIAKDSWDRIAQDHPRSPGEGPPI